MDERKRRFAAINARYWTHAKTPRHLARFLVRTSFEDSSDVSDYFHHHDTFEAAEADYRALDIWDLDTRDHWDVEWTQVAHRSPDPSS
jgi:hypothetical protein